MIFFYHGEKKKNIYIYRTFHTRTDCCVNHVKNAKVFLYILHSFVTLMVLKFADADDFCVFLCVE